MEREAKQHNAHIQAKGAKEVQAQTRRNSKGEAGDAEGCQPQSEADDHHGNLEHSLEESPQCGRALARSDGEGDTDEQTENHHSQEPPAFVFGIEGIHGLGEGIFRNEVEKGGGDGLGLATTLDTFLGGPGIGLHKRLAAFGRKRPPRLDEIHEAEGNANTCRGEGKCGEEGTPTHTPQRADIPHLHGSYDDC